MLALPTRCSDSEGSGMLIGERSQSDLEVALPTGRATSKSQEVESSTLSMRGNSTAQKGAACS